MRRAVGCLIVVVMGMFASAAGAKVLLVGSYHGVRGQYKTIQSAVSAAHKGDWILVGPGDYKERADHKANRGPRPAGNPAGLVIAKARVRLRGMNRNTVIVDGTKPGSGACSAKKAAQDFGRAGAAGKAPLGRNGILIYRASNVWVQNLTVCNFLGGSGNGVGNQVWWDGGYDTAKIGGHGFLGSYLSATSTFFDTNATAATCGIFSANWSGGTWDQTYASNFNDSGYYIGACQQQCNQTINHARAAIQLARLLGSNYGGRLLVQNSEFDHNKDGFDTNSQNGDNPPPQNGPARPGSSRRSPARRRAGCSRTTTSTTTTTRTCRLRASPATVRWGPGFHSPALATTR